MIKRLVLVLAITVGLVATVAALPASADVERYQMQSGKLTIALPEYAGNVHTFNITWSPCDGSFTGAARTDSPVGIGETILGTIWDGSFDFVSTYTTGLPGYQWYYDGPFSGGRAYDRYLGNPYTVGGFLITPTLGPLSAVTDWKNHGEFVSQAQDKEDAAHSCLGMPITH